MSLQETAVADLSELVPHLLAPPMAGTRWFRGQGCHRRPLRASLVRRLTPYDAGKLLELERRLITRFRQRSLPFWPEGYRQADWEHLFSMQHFGVPTRLLDWTESALIGAYFSADHDRGRCECGAGDCQPTLWVLHPVGFNRNNKRLVGMDAGILATSDKVLDNWAPGVDPTLFAPDAIALYGTHNSARIVAQQGTFTVSGKEDAPLEESAQVLEFDHILEKIVVDCDHQVMREQLATLGVTRAAVYPDLVGLAHDIAAAEIAL